jgi:mono/diheme cytochrome c family protein
MRERGIQTGNDIRAGDLDEQAGRDLFAYFYSAHFFDKPGDAGRGKALFSSRHCADCHGLETAKLPAAKPVAQWTSIGRPIELVGAMWNHAATMRQEFARRKFGWPSLDSQDLADMLVYLRNLPASRNAAFSVEITSGDNGRALFESKGCAGCHTGDHTGNNDLTRLLRGKTLNDIAAEMWNHAPKMTAIPPPLSLDEMRELTSYLWAGQYFQDSGSASAGARVFASKRCVACHGNPSSGAPKLAGSGREFSGASMVSALWRHGPRMLDRMKTQAIPWPRFEGQDMANLIAYLNGSR